MTNDWRIQCKALQICLVGTMAVLIACPGVSATDDETPIETKASQADIAVWQSRRFGMFIHWGPVSLKGTEIGWSRGREIPIDEYDQLYKQFNPTEFDATEWVRVAKEAGMKYIVITTKHHDGFCLWPSKYTDYHIGNTPFKRDVLRELSDACRAAGIGFGTYYSVCDWYHPDFPKGSPGGSTDKPNPNLDRYTEYLRNQVTELIENYGPLSVLWFDVPRPVGSEHGIPTINLVRKLQPNIIINNRAYSATAAEREAAGKHEIVGDYSTPEQEIGGFDRERPWETCMTIGRQWAWKPNDTMKSTEQCIQALLHTVGGDGNLLFNVGPMPDGRIEGRQVDRLKEMGAWLDQYGEGVYGTRGGPFKPSSRWGAATCKDDNIYLYIMKWPKEGGLQLPSIGMKVLAANALSGGTATVVQTEDGITINVAPEHRAPIATVVKLQVAGNAFEIAPTEVFSLESGSVALNVPAKASNIYHGYRRYGPDKAVDDDPDTRWFTDDGTKTAWLEVDLGKPTEIARVVLNAGVGHGDKVKSFELQYKEDDTWKTIFAAAEIGVYFEKTFEPVEAQIFRLNILDASEGPTLSEFQLFKNE